MFKPRFYQEEGIAACLSILNSTKKSCKELVVAPTAAGKSLYVADTVKKLDEAIIILQPNKELLAQNYGRFVKMGGVASICCSSLTTKILDNTPYTEIDGELINCREVSKVTYATVGSVKAHLEELKKLGVKKAIIDECFPYATPILTEEGVLRIGDIYELFNKGYSINVKSYNEVRNIYEYKPVTGVICNGVKSTIKVYYGVRENVSCTPNHKFLTKRGWVKACGLKHGDALIYSSTEPNCKSLADLNGDQRDLVIGGSLGDGSIDYRKKGNHSSRIKFTHGSKQEQYIRWKAEILNSGDAVYKIEENGYSKKEAYTFNSRTFYFEDRFKSYEYQISILNNKSLAVLWMDDGNLSKKENGGSLYSLCDNKELVILLNKKIKSLGVQNTTVVKTKSSSTNRPLWFIRFTKQSVEDISRLCSQYVHETMSYKIIKEYRQLTGSYVWDNNISGVVKVVKKVIPWKEERVFDIEVQDNHNFIVTSTKAYKKANYNVDIKNFKGVVFEGIVVHNCHLGTKSDSQIRRLFNDLGITHVVGLTATPVYLQGGLSGASLKMMNRTRGKLFSTIRQVTQIKTLVRSGFWSKLLYQVNDTDESYLQQNSNGSDFTVKSLTKFYESNNLKGRIIEEVRNLLQEGRKSILVFVPTIQEANDLFASFPNSAVVHSKDPKSRDYVVEAFRKLEIPVVFNVSVLSVGFDHPELDAIITARPTGSIAVYYQQIGRGVRIFEGKENCKIVDFSGNVKKFGRVEGLHFEDLEHYGWGLFNEKDELLTDYPLAAVTRPTKKSLMLKYNKTNLQKNVVEKDDTTVLWFGKHKGKSVKRLVNTEKNYVSWMYDEFNFQGVKMKKLKREIEILMGLPITL